MNRNIINAKCSRENSCVQRHQPYAEVLVNGCTYLYTLTDIHAVVPSEKITSEGDTTINRNFF
jgi:hypothetical protein